jgi:hypothetical protein
VTDWIPSQVGLQHHPKTRRVARALGAAIPHVVGYLHCLWYWTLAYAPDGDLEDFEPDDLADAAGWEGDPDTFVNALLDCGSKGHPGFLGKVNGRLVVHDWEDNQGDAYRARIQAAAKKRAQRAQQGQEQGDVPEVGESVPEAGDSVPITRDLARAKDQTDKTIKPLSDAEPSDGSIDAGIGPVREVFDYWREAMGHSDAKLKAGSKRARAVRGRLKDGYTVTQLKQAIDGCRASPHHRGQNATGTVYDDLELICRDEVHVEQFIAKANGKRLSALDAIDDQWGDA